MGGALLESAEDAALGTPLQAPRNHTTPFRYSHEARPDDLTLRKVSVARQPRMEWDIAEVQAKVAQQSQTQEHIVAEVGTIKGTLDRQNNVWTVWKLNYRQVSIMYQRK